MQTSFCLTRCYLQICKTTPCTLAEAPLAPCLPCCCSLLPLQAAPAPPHEEEVGLGEVWRRMFLKKDKKKKQEPIL
jgi:hypothetical protein